MGVRPGYKLTEVGVIPDDWRSSFMGKEAELLTGFPFPSSGFAKSGVRLLRGSNVKRGVVDWSTEITQYWPAVAGKIQPYELRRDDLVIAMDGALVGRSFASIAESDLPALLVQRVARLRSKRASQGLLCAWVASDFFVRHVDEVKTHTAIPHISPKDIRDFPLAVPSDEREQRAIAEALSDVDALLGALDRFIAKKRDLKQAAMQQLLTGQTRLPGFNSEWEVKRLGKIAPLQRGFDLPSPSLRSGPYPVVYSNGVLNYHAQFMAQGPGVVTGRSGTIGRVTFVEGPYWPHNTALWVTSFRNNDPRFVFYVYTRIGFERFASGSGVPTLNRNDAHTFEVAVPATRAEQEAIAAVLSDIDLELSALDRRRTKTRALKQAMMQELLTGRTRLA